MSEGRNPRDAAAKSIGPGAPPDLRAVSRKIARRTTDLIAVGVVLIGGLSIGRQVVEWWRDEPAQGAAAPQASGIDPTGDGPLRLEFGDYPLAMERQTIVGDQDSA